MNVDTALISQSTKKRMSPVPDFGGRIKGIRYPESDGEPMANNTVQFEYIVSIKSGFEALFKERNDVFVAGDLLWYPVEGNNQLRLAPDVMVIFGRPKGDRGSYLQWLEDNIPPQIVFEILSPGNRPGEMVRKFHFYDQFGVAEYYIYDPDDHSLNGWLRRDNHLQEIESMVNWLSPLSGVRFALEEDGLVLYYPNGLPFESYLELLARAESADLRAEVAEQRAQNAEQRAENAEQRAESAEQRSQRLTEQLKALGINPDEG